MMNIKTSNGLLGLGCLVVACGGRADGGDTGSAGPDSTAIHWGGASTANCGSGGSSASSSGGSGSGGSSASSSGGILGSSSGGTWSGGPVGTPIVLAAVTSPGMIAVDDTSVYWAPYEIGPVGKVPIGGGPWIALDSLAGAHIALDATRVFTVDLSGSNTGGSSGGNADQGLFVACAKTGCNGHETTLVSSSQRVGGIAVDATNIYWTNLSGSVMTTSSAAVTKVPLAGGAPTTLVAGGIDDVGGPIAVSAGYVFYGGGPGGADLMRVAVDGGAPAVLFASVAQPGSSSGAASSGGGPGPGPGIFAITADPTNVYFSVGGGLVIRAPHAGGTYTVLATDQASDQGNSGDYAITTDGASVYWAAEALGMIAKVPIGGGAVTVLATGQPHPDGIAVDDTSVYWSAGDAIKKIAK